MAIVHIEQVGAREVLESKDEILAQLDSRPVATLTLAGVEPPTVLHILRGSTVIAIEERPADAWGRMNALAARAQRNQISNGEQYYYQQ